MPADVLTRKSIARVAVELIDRDGYPAFTVPRLADELGIRTPSLYYHFADRAEILAEVARQVVLETELPDRDPEAPWADYFVALSVNFRRTILRHRNTAPVLVQFLPRDILTPLYENAAELLSEVAGLPAAVHVLILDGLEKLTIGTALIESSSTLGPRQAVFTNLDAGRYPHLTAAAQASTLGAEQLFVATVRAFLEGAIGGPT
jgi:TetR/AcrR family transcriptional regulator, tetracycline repressor protein